MTNTEVKPLNWTPAPDVGLTVTRRADGGMHVTFTDVSHTTLAAWREFALEHLFDSDRRTRNLYDLRQVKEITEEAIQFAVEANSDPSARNIRLAVVVATQAVSEAVREIVAISTAPGGGTNMKLFSDMDEAEAWLSRPLEML